MSTLVELGRRDDTVLVEPEIDWPRPLDLRAMLACEPEPPRMIIPDWLPCGYATLLAGHGGAGKSSIALYLASCIATGRPFFGLPTEQRRVLYLSCEDRADVLHWRLARIQRHLGVEVGELAAGLSIMDLVGHPTTLYKRINGTMLKTAQYELLRERFAGHSVLVVDGAADAFGGNENDRHEVKSFINSLVGLIPTDGAVLLQHHVNRTSAAGDGSTEGYSGSTGWHNSVRARWYLYPETEREDGQAQATGDLLLELKKANLGRAEQAMRFRWDDDAHLFVGRMEQSSEFDRRLQEREEREGIVAALAELEAKGQHVPAAMQGGRTAWTVLREVESLPENLKKPAAKRRFWRHVEHLRQKGIVREGSIRRANRHHVATLTLEASNGEGCGGAPYASRFNPETPLNADAGATAPYASHTQGGYRGGARAHCPRCGGDGCAWCETAGGGHAV